MTNLDESCKSPVGCGCDSEEGMLRASLSSSLIHLGWPGKWAGLLNLLQPRAPDVLSGLNISHAANP